MDRFLALSKTSGRPLRFQHILLWCFRRLNHWHDFLSDGVRLLVLEKTSAAKGFFRWDFSEVDLEDVLICV
jgi:hypothetical protein